MKLFTIPNMFGLAMGVFGLAYLADGVNGIGYAPVASHPAGQAVSGTLNAIGEFGSNLIAPAAQADEMQSEDFSDLLRIEEPGYQLSYDDSVSTQVLAHHTIRKFEFGRMSEVSVVRTPTGTYSTDGLQSNHVIYSGIELVRVADGGVKALIWDPIFGWLPLSMGGSSNVTTYGHTSNGGDVRTNGSHVCVQENSFRYCN